MNYSLKNTIALVLSLLFLSKFHYSWKYHCWYLLVLLHASKTTFGLPPVFSVAMQSPFDLFLSWNVLPSSWGILIQIARAGGFTFFPLHITAAISPELSSWIKIFNQKVIRIVPKLPSLRCRVQTGTCIANDPSS